MERLVTLKVEEVLPHIAEGATMTILNNVIQVNSKRMRTFKEKGVVCAYCGLVGDHFIVERQTWANFKKRIPFTGSYHINLYASTPGGRVLMTRDHIYALSDGGCDTLANSITCCTDCNTNKSDAPPTPEFVAIHGGEYDEAVRARKRAEKARRGHVQSVKQTERAKAAERLQRARIKPKELQQS